MKKETIYPLTSLRFFFAFAVFLSHLKISRYEGLPIDLQLLAREGFIGVSFFYILSGFILAYNYEERIIKHEISKKDFFITRLARIWPMHILTLLAHFPLSLAVLSGGMLAFSAKVILNFFMLHSLVPIRAFHFSFNVPSWSISNELIFYMLFPFIIPFLKKGKYAYAVLAMYFGLFIAGLFVAGRYLEGDMLRAFFYANPFLRLTDFLIGIFLFKAYQLLKPAYASVSRHSAGIAEMTCLLLLLLVLAFKRHWVEPYRFSFAYWVPMAAIVFVFAHARGFISSVMSHRWLVLLGEISFSFYLWHFVVISYADKLTKDAGLTDVENGVLCFTVSIVLSYFSYRFVEKPINKYVRNRLLPKRKNTVVADEEVSGLQQESPLALVPGDAPRR